MNKIIDVSSYNGTVNWKYAKQQDVSGAILKIVRKDMSKDTKFVVNCKDCNEYKIPWGVYNYSYATTTAKAKQDMNKVCDILDTCDKTYFKLGVWFDIEDNVQAKLSKISIATILNAAKTVVESRGYNFGIYTGLSYYMAHMDTANINCKNWWIARYYKGYTEMPFTATPNDDYKPLSTCFAWQYTSSGTFSPSICSGNGGKVDLNILYKEFETKNQNGSDSMTITIGSARIDENGNLTGGKVGDQKQSSSSNDTKGEVSMQSFYVHKKGWYILRPKSAEVANKIAAAMKTACNNSNIGYDQSNRLGIIKYGTSTKTKTECDCSSLVRQCIIEATGKDPGNFNTENEASKITAMGNFSKLSYTSGTKLYTGDILVTKTKGHTIVVVKGYGRTETASSDKPSTTKTEAKAYSGNFPRLPLRGYYMLGDGYNQLKGATNNIKRVQKVLNWAMGASITVDGDYGEKTANLCGKFQSKYGLEADKKFGKKTLKKLKTIKK